MMKMSHSLHFTLVIVLCYLAAQVCTADADDDFSDSRLGEHPRNLGRPVSRDYDEIKIGGRMYHTGTKVVLWSDPHGYDAYRVEKRFGPFANASYAATIAANPKFGAPNRYGIRTIGLNDSEIEQIRGGQWPLDLLRKQIKQFLIHYDVSGISSACFQTLQDESALSVHFMLDLDGTIYQTLDVQERAYHAGVANTHAIGVEIANVGAYPVSEANPLGLWYKSVKGRTVIQINETLYPNNGAILTPGFVGAPVREQQVTGVLQGINLTQYDFTKEQYAALPKLIATISSVFPDITLDYPRGADGQMLTVKMPDADIPTYAGLLGHFHVSSAKVDPGPAFQWDRVIQDTKKYKRRCNSGWPF